MTWGGPSESYYDGRNYELFSILADVRNSDEFIPIDSPRGIPEDSDERIRKASDDYGIDGHSHSHFTLEELLNYDWTQTARMSGIVSGDIYLKWIRWEKMRGESPDSYWGSGGGGQTITEGEMDATVRTVCALQGDARNVTEQQIAELKKLQAEIHWEMPYYKCVRNFWSDTIPRLLRLGSPPNVRIVFWFDN